MSEQPSKPISRLSRKLRDRERINEQNFNSRRIIKKYEAFPSLDQKISIDNSQSLDSFVRRIDDDWRKRLNRFNRCSITARNSKARSKRKRLSRGLYIYREREGCFAVWISRLIAQTIFYIPLCFFPLFHGLRFRDFLLFREIFIRSKRSPRSNISWNISTERERER